MVDNAAESSVGAKVTSQPATVDGFESALIQAQWSMRVSTWAAAQSAVAP
jgi:hypothetical protein